LLARATAGECGAHFDAVSIPDILSKYFGESESRLHAIFETARRHAPSILFIDELDALGVKRSDASGPMAGLVNVLLTEIDGASSNNDGVLVLGATNSPWRIDPAFRRPGRFDNTVFVPPPDAAARSSIIEILLADVPCEKFDFEKVVAATDRFSGADLRAAIDAALELAIAEEMRTGKDTSLTGKMLLAAIKATRPTTLEWLDQASNYASYANNSGVYDELAEYLRKR
jgi:SpoVK/Ycf46/Vps4 family AAA+-type ATPase